MVKYFVSLLFCLLCIFYFTASEISASDVVGVITQTNTETPLEGISVVILETGDSTSTDINGQYFFSNVPDASYTFLIGGNNYSPLIIKRTVGSCCTGIRGNIDNDPADNIDIADLVFYVQFSFGTPPGDSPACFEEADVDNSNSLDIADIVYLVNYMFGTPSGPQPFPCI